MKLDQKAKQYSEAMFNVAIESQSEIDIKDSLINVCNAIRNSAEFIIDINAKNNFGKTAFHLAHEYGHSKIVEMLIQRSVECTVRRKVQENEKFVYRYSLFDF